MIIHLVQNHLNAMYFILTMVSLSVFEKVSLLIIYLHNMVVCISEDILYHHDVVLQMDGSVKNLNHTLPTYKC